VNRVQDAMLISTFLNPVEEVVVDDNDDILVDIELARHERTKLTKKAFEFKISGLFFEPVDFPIFLS
jgi:hypothetical protein